MRTRNSSLMAGMIHRPRLRKLTLTIHWGERRTRKRHHHHRLLSMLLTRQIIELYYSYSAVQYCKYKMRLQFFFSFYFIAGSFYFCFLTVLAFFAGFGLTLSDLVTSAFFFEFFIVVVFFGNGSVGLVFGLSGPILIFDLFFLFLCSDVQLISVHACWQLTTYEWDACNRSNLYLK